MGITISLSWIRHPTLIRARRRPPGPSNDARRRNRRGGRETAPFFNSRNRPWRGATRQNAEDRLEAAADFHLSDRALVFALRLRFLRDARRVEASVPELDERDGRAQARDPEQKHPPDEPTLERAEPAFDDAQPRQEAAFERGDLTAQLRDPLLQLCLETRFERGESGAQLRAQLGDPLLQLRVETGEVELVEIPEFQLVRGVHLVEPVHELVNHRVSELIVELS